MYVLCSPWRIRVSPSLYTRSGRPGLRTSCRWSCRWRSTDQSAHRPVSVRQHLSPAEAPTYHQVSTRGRICSGRITCRWPLQVVTQGRVSIRPYGMADSRRRCWGGHGWPQTLCKWSYRWHSELFSEGSSAQWHALAGLVAGYGAGGPARGTTGSCWAAGQSYLTQVLKDCLLLVPAAPHTMAVSHSVPELPLSRSSNRVHATEMPQRRKATMLHRGHWTPQPEASPLLHSCVCCSLAWHERTRGQPEAALITPHWQANLSVLAVVGQVHPLRPHQAGSNI